MKMLISFILAALAGFCAHQTRPFLYKNLGPGWINLACYTFGVLLALPFFLSNLATCWHRHPAQSVHEQVEQGAISYLAAFLGVGIGDSFAYFVEEATTKKPGVVINRR